MKKTITVSFTLNGESVSVETSPTARALDLLRDHFGLTASKEGCGSGECGACAVLVDATPMLSCLMLAVQLEGREVVTPEGLGTPANPHPVQAAFAENAAVQCGFCTPGMTVAVAGFLAGTPDPDREQARRAISGNLCRCTGYVRIVDAVMAAAETMRGDGS